MFDDFWASLAGPNGMPMQAMPFQPSPWSLAGPQLGQAAGGMPLPPERPLGDDMIPRGLPTMAAGGAGPDMPGATATSPGAMPDQADKPIPWAGLLTSGAQAFGQGSGLLGGGKAAAGGGGGGAAPGPRMGGGMGPQPFDMQGYLGLLGRKRLG